jgi:hypothetical protein
MFCHAIEWLANRKVPFIKVRALGGSGIEGYYFPHLQKRSLHEQTLKHDECGSCVIRSRCHLTLGVDILS